MQVRFGASTLSSLMSTAQSRVNNASTSVGTAYSYGRARASSVNSCLEEVKTAMTAQNAVIKALVERMDAVGNRQDMMVRTTQNPPAVPPKAVPSDVPESRVDLDPAALKRKLEADIELQQTLELYERLKKASERRKQQGQF